MPLYYKTTLDYCSDCARSKCFSELLLLARIVMMVIQSAPPPKKKIMPGKCPGTKTRNPRVFFACFSIY